MGGEIVCDVLRLCKNPILTSRPKTLNDVSAQDNTVTVLKRTLGSSNLPHMLFYGPPGTGKTSTILALSRELFGPELMKSRVLELNASDERGISIVRDKIKNFARTVVSRPSEATRAKYPCPPYKIIILDEADSMTADAQSALRRTMENYSTITRFCLICNYVTRIIDPIASRCSKFRFRPLDQENTIERLQYIAKNENVPYEDGVLETLLSSSEGDLRKAITLLQSAAKLQQSDQSLAKVTVESINEISGTLPEDVVDNIFTTIMTPGQSSTKFTTIVSAVENLIKNGWSGAQLLTQIHDKLMVDETIDIGQKSQISEILSETDKSLTDGADEHLQVLSMCTRISQVISK